MRARRLVLGFAITRQNCSPKGRPFGRPRPLSSLAAILFPRFGGLKVLLSSGVIVLGVRGFLLLLLPLVVVVVMVAGHFKARLR